MVGELLVNEFIYWRMGKIGWGMFWIGILGREKMINFGFLLTQNKEIALINIPIIVCL